MKRIIPTRIHGMLDYFFAFVLISAPTVFRFAYSIVPTVFFILMGLSVIVYSLFTRYEQGSFDALTMKQHLKIDLGVAGVVMVSPFLLGFYDDVFVPNLLIGVMMIVATFMSKEEVTASEEVKVTRLRVTRPRTREELYRMYGRSVARNRK